MKCISLWQPWASLCVLPSLADPDVAVKPYETRHWATDYRGTLLIHAAKRWTTDQFRTVSLPYFHRSLCRAFKLDANQLIGGGHLPLGCIVGVVDLVECWEVGDDGSGPALHASGVHPNGSRYWSKTPLPTGDALAFGDFSVGRHAWQNAKPRMFKTPIPYVGRQGFFDVPDEVVAEQLQQVRAA